MNATLDIGFAGAGRMGTPMMARLLRAGHRVRFYDPDLDAGSQLGELGATRAATAAELASADVSISIVTDGDAFLGLVDVIAGTAAHGHVHISMSTVGPTAIRAAAAAAPGIALVDAPVSGSVALAASGELTAMVGASTEDYARVRPLLSDLTRAQFHVGELGAGSAIKLAVNAVVGATNLAIAEALLLAEVFGIDRSSAYDVLLASVVSSPFLHYKRRAFTDRDAPVDGSVVMLRKDLALARAAAQEAGLELPGLALAESTLAAAAAAGLGDRDVASVIEWLARGATA